MGNEAWLRKFLGLCKSRFHHDMAWLYDFPLDEGLSSLETDWHALYKRLDTVTSHSLKNAKRHTYEVYALFSVHDWSDLSPTLKKNLECF
jgi:hypothetical protein